MPGGQFLELLLLKWSDFDNSKIAAGHFTHNYGLDHNCLHNIFLHCLIICKASIIIIVLYCYMQNPAAF